jgi:hypothetical protein
MKKTIAVCLILISFFAYFRVSIFFLSSPKPFMAEDGQSFLGTAGNFDGTQVSKDTPHKLTRKTLYSKDESLIAFDSSETFFSFPPMGYALHSFSSIHAYSHIPYTDLRAPPIV